MRQQSSFTGKQPEIGDRFRFDAVEWEIVDQPTRQVAAGRESIEWRCVSEFRHVSLVVDKSDRQERWYVAELLAPEEVSLENGQRLGAWLADNAAGHPPVLVHADHRYQRKIADVGEAPNGGSDDADAVVWEYGDVASENNLVVGRSRQGLPVIYRRWALNASNAEFLERHEVRRTDLSPRPGKMLSPFVASAACLLFFFLISLMISSGSRIGIDRMLSFSIPLSVLAGALLVGQRYVDWLIRLSLVALLLGFVFYFLPPTESAVGLVILLAAPSIAIQRCRAFTAQSRSALLYLSTASIFLPLCVIGMMGYFRTAPEPRTLKNFGMALVPAVLGGSWAALSALFWRRFGRKAGVETAG